MAAPDPLFTPGLAYREEVISPVAATRAKLARSLRDRVAGPNAEKRSRAIWLASGERRHQAGDPICRVHGHASMYVGGIRALLLQALHPLAMAGVGEHSGYRDDPWGRLQRTSEFIAMTTFGPVESAERMIDKINRVHEMVVGTARDGRPYAATDPHLLAWVHVAEIDSFLTAYQRYSRTPFTAAEADRYVDETAYVASRLGVADPPRTVNDLQLQLADFRPELEASPGALDVVRFLLKEPPLPRTARPGFSLLAAGAVGLLPGYARDLLGLRLPGPLRAVDAGVMRRVAQPMGGLATSIVGWALTDPAEIRNRRGSVAPAGRS